MKNLLLLILIFISIQLKAQEVSKSFLIVHSTKKYSAALKSAQKVAYKMGIPINLRDCYKANEEGLTSSVICGCGEKHGYIPRGRFDDGEYISIEYSSSYESFAPNYYIVIISSGDDEAVKSLLSKSQEFNKSAFVKKSKVYMGCMH